MNIGRDSGKPQISPFNDALGTLGRLGFWWQKANDAAFNMHFYDRLNALDVIYEELYAWGTPQEIQDLAPYSNRIKLLLPVAFLTDGQQTYLNPKIIDKLNEYARNLRKLWHRAELDMKAQEKDMMTEDMREEFY